ncbi:MAG: hypothetical protein AAGC56_10965, partial [Pseudomonadota bacterium]
MTFPVAAQEILSPLALSLIWAPVLFFAARALERSLPRTRRQALWAGALACAVAPTALAPLFAMADLSLRSDHAVHGDVSAPIGATDTRAHGGAWDVAAADAPSVEAIRAVDVAPKPALEPAPQTAAEAANLPPVPRNEVGWRWLPMPHLRLIRSYDSERH